MNRRKFFKYITISTAAISCPSWITGILSPQNYPLITKTIHSTRQQVPVIGMGTWLTFDVGSDDDLRDHRAEILRTFFNRGGGVIDSSPMYGSSESVVGHGLRKLGHPDGLFSATKVWTSSTAAGRDQIEESLKFWETDHLDLEQVHNLVNWESHLKTLFELKQEGKVKHVGVTTYGGYRHEELARIMNSQPIDFIQVTYNVENRQAEDHILDLAQEKGIAVIANRPFGGGSLIYRVQRHPVPSWAPDIGCDNWPQLLLKFIVSHPAITCAIPATTQIVHMKENMGACRGELLSEASRQRIADHVEQL